MPPLPAAFAVPGALDTPTGGYAYAREILARLPAHGIAASLVRLPDAFPDPRETDLVETARLLADVPPEAALLVDGLAYGAIPAATIDALARPIVALCHHPLGLEAGLAPDRAAALVASERAALARLAPGARVDATQDLAGHLMEAHAPAGVALAAALIAAGETGEVAVTSIGHRRGEGLVRLVAG